MAILEREEDKQKENMNGGSLASSSMSGVLGGGITGGQRSPSESGSFVNLQDYKSINQPQSEQFGQKMAKDTGESFGFGDEQQAFKSSVGNIRSGGKKDYSSDVEAARAALGSMANEYNTALGKDYTSYYDREGAFEDTNTTAGQRILDNYLLSGEDVQKGYTTALSDYDPNSWAQGVLGTTGDQLSSSYQSDLDKYTGAVNRLNELNKSYEDMGNTWSSMSDKGYISGLPEDRRNELEQSFRDNISDINKQYMDTKTDLSVYDDLFNKRASLEALSDLGYGGEYDYIPDQYTADKTFSLYEGLNEIQPTYGSAGTQTITPEETISGIDARQQRQEQIQKTNESQQKPNRNTAKNSRTKKKEEDVAPPPLNRNRIKSVFGDIKPNTTYREKDLMKDYGYTGGSPISTKRTSSGYGL